MPDQSSGVPPEPRGGRDQVPMQVASDAALPPHPLDKRWYAHVDGQNYGPYTGHDIRRMVENNQIQGTDFLCPEGGSAWVQAQAEPLLGALFRARAQNQPPQVSTVTANGGGTVVQVTNTVPTAPNLAQAALLMEGVSAAKSPGIALLLSFLMSGLGQMYNGQVAKGILMLLGCIALWFILLGWIVWIWSMVDAYHTAKKLNLRYQQRLLAGLM